MSKKRKRWLGITAALLVLLALVAGLATWLLYTEAGLRQAFAVAARSVPGELGSTRIAGSLAGGARITGFHYADHHGFKLRIEHAQLALRPAALLLGRLHVRHAEISGVVLNLPRTEAAPAPAAATPQPPFPIAVDELRLTRLTITHAGNPGFAVEQLTAAGRWTRQQIDIRRLWLQAPAGRISLAGKFTTRHGLRGQLAAQFDGTPDGMRLHGQATVAGDGQQWRLHAQTTTPAHAELTATLQTATAHAWTLALRAPRFDASTLAWLPSAFKTVAIELHGSGDQSAGQLAGTLGVNDHALTIQSANFHYRAGVLGLTHLQLRSPDMPGVVTVNGSVKLAEPVPTASLQVGWSDVRLPADLAGQTLATDGSLRLAGSLQNYAVQGSLALGPPGQTTRIELAAHGGTQAIQLHSLRLVQRHGSLDARGDLRWLPRLAWQLDARGQRFNPGAVFADWDGRLDFRLVSQGALTARGPEASLTLNHVAGNLRGHAVGGSSATLETTPDNLLQGSLQLRADRSRIQVQGRSGRQTNARLTFDIGDLGDWLPRAAGQLQGEFALHGAWPKLAVTGQLQGRNLVHEQIRLGDLQGAVRWPAQPTANGQVELTITDAHMAGLDFESIHFDAQGSLAAHRLRLDARGPTGSFGATVAGRWQARTRHWTATLDHLELAIPGLPRLQQAEASALDWRAGRFGLGRTCLTADTRQTCIAATRTPRGNWDTQLALQRLPLQMLAALAATPAPLRATGSVSGDARLRIDARGDWVGAATLTATNGSLALAAMPTRPLLEWAGLQGDADFDSRQRRAELHGQLADGGHIDGALAVQGEHQALRGHFDVDLRELGGLAALAPELANVHGALQGQLRMAGTLATPEFSGHLGLRDFAAEIPRAGLALHAGAASLIGDPQGRLAIEGQVTSGTGVLRIQGSTRFAATAPLLLDISGQDVLLIDTPAAQVHVSPDLHITRNAGQLTMTGRVAIPHARIAAEKLPGQIPGQASSDVVIVDQPQAAPVAPLALAAAIDVKLGEDVKVQGYGLDGRVQGQLAVRVQAGRAATGSGEIRVAGSYHAYGQKLAIQRGRLLFAASRLDNPGLDLRATRDIRGEDIVVGVQVRGTAQKPQLSVFSEPAMQQAEALSWLVTGRPLDALKSGEGNTLESAAQALGGFAGDRIAKVVGERIGVEAGVSRNEVLGASAFTAGKYLSPRLFMSYGVALYAPGQVVTLRYTLNRFLQFEAESATTGNRASLNYRIER